MKTGFVLRKVVQTGFVLRRMKMKGIMGLITPLLLHMIISEVTVLLAGQYLDAACCASLAAVLVLPIAFWMQKKQKEEVSAADGHLLTGRQFVIAAGLCFVGGGILNLLWSGVMNLFQITEKFSNTAQEQLLGSQILIQIVGLGFLVPLAEEMIFRGLIYRRMRNWFPAFLAVTLSALLFAVYHGNPVQMIYAFPMAIILALLLEKGKSMMFPVLFHMGANMTAIILNLFGMQ